MNFVGSGDVRGLQAAAAAKGATATTSAVAGASGAGSLSKGDGVAGKKGPSPAFDPSAQIGAMAPLGFFDPAGQELQLAVEWLRSFCFHLAGFSKKGDEDGFRTLRAAEIKHGRALSERQHLQHATTTQPLRSSLSLPKVSGAHGQVWQ